MEGPAEEVWRSLNKFLGETDQTVTQISQFIIKINLDNLLTKFQSIIKIDKEVGPVVSSEANINALNDREKIIFTMLVKRIVHLLGFAKEDTVSVNDVQKDVKSKSLGVLISQMIPEKMIQNLAESGKKGEYRVTDYGIEWFISKALPKLEKINA